jgi:hypothetical protein
MHVSGGPWLRTKSEIRGEETRGTFLDIQLCSLLVEDKLHIKVFVDAGFFMFAYCVFFYFTKTDMSGFMQTSFFYGYMAMASYAVFLMLGAVGYGASRIFVDYAYAYKCALAYSPYQFPVHKFHFQVFDISSPAPDQPLICMMMQIGFKAPADHTFLLPFLSFLQAGITHIPLYNVYSVALHRSTACRAKCPLAIQIGVNSSIALDKDHNMFSGYLLTMLWP